MGMYPLTTLFEKEEWKQKWLLLVNPVSQVLPMQP